MRARCAFTVVESLDDHFDRGCRGRKKLIARDGNLSRRAISQERLDPPTSENEAADMKRGRCFLRNSERKRNREDVIAQRWEFKRERDCAILDRRGTSRRAAAD